MRELLLYLDASALVKLVLPEKESQFLRKSLESWPARVSSELARVEVIRAARRAAMDPAVEQRAHQVAAGLHLLKIDGELLDQAAALEPRKLGSLDALHLATALSLGADLGAIATYDAALATAAAGLGVVVLAPGKETAGITGPSEDTD